MENVRAHQLVIYGICRHGMKKICTLCMWHTLMQGLTPLLLMLFCHLCLKYTFILHALVGLFEVKILVKLFILFSPDVALT